jgi:hypothetical protein
MLDATDRRPRPACRILGRVLTARVAIRQAKRPEIGLIAAVWRQIEV